MKTVNDLPREVWDDIVDHLIGEVVTLAKFRRYVDLQKTHPSIGAAIRRRLRVPLQHIQAALFHESPKRFWGVPGIFKNPFILVRIEDEVDLDRYMVEFRSIHSTLKTGTPLKRIGYVLNLAKILMRTKSFELKPLSYSGDDGSERKVNLIPMSTMAHQDDFGSMMIAQDVLCMYNGWAETDRFGRSTGWNNAERWDVAIVYKKSILCVNYDENLPKNTVKDHSHRHITSIRTRKGLFWVEEGKLVSE